MKERNILEFGKRMTEQKKLNLFISYSHKDEDSINKFKDTIKNAEIDKKISIWSDREIEGGEDLKGKINGEINDADIVCLFISQDFLDSNPCMKEKDIAFRLKTEKNIRVVPIILSKCNWKECKNLKTILALPTDGKPLSSFSEEGLYWNDLKLGLVKIVNTEYFFKNLELKKEHSSFLEDAELLTNAHPDKNKVFISDIFVYPKVSRFEYIEETESYMDSEKIIGDLIENQKIHIVGEDQSGKTTLCKKLFKKIKDLNLLPIFLHDEENRFKGPKEALIQKRFKEQYKKISKLNDIDRERIVLIVDDFHKAKKKDKLLQYLSNFKYQILVTNDIPILDINNEMKINTYIHYKIEEFTASSRNKLIRKWIDLSESEMNSEGNNYYESLDKKTEQVSTTLGKVFGKGIMPAYPFYILSILRDFESLTNNLRSEITSQGYCYEALITFYLNKHNVKNDEFDYYINFLQEFAYFFFKKKQRTIPEIEFQKFIKSYSSKFLSLLDELKFMRTLQKANLIRKDNMKNYSFSSDYIYYFFVAKYIASQINKNKKEIKKVIEEIINNLHKTENAYISIFITHHTENDYLFKELIKSSKKLFKEYKPVSLNKKELKFLDKKEKLIIKATLPSEETTPEKARSEMLSAQDEMEIENKRNLSEEDKIEDIEFAKSIKTVEVIGSIIKNRTGSLEKEKLKELFIDAMNVHLRMMHFLLEFIKKDINQDAIISFISVEVNKHIEREGKNSIPIEDRKKFSKIIFWNWIFFILFGYVMKTVVSLGSDKLGEILELVTKEVNTPVVELVKQGINHKYAHSLDERELSKILQSRGYSKTAKRILEFQVSMYLHLNKLNRVEKQRIKSLLGVETKPN